MELHFFVVANRMALMAIVAPPNTKDSARKPPMAFWNAVAQIAP
jgi:hypothetical protein